MVLYNQSNICATNKTAIAIGCITINNNENIKYKKSKFLNPSLTGNLLTESSQLLSSISFIPTNLPLAPYLYSSIKLDMV